MMDGRERAANRLACPTSSAPGSADAAAAGPACCFRTLTLCPVMMATLEATLRNASRLASLQGQQRKQMVSGKLALHYCWSHCAATCVSGSVRRCAPQQCYAQCSTLEPLLLTCLHLTLVRRPMAPWSRMKMSLSLRLAPGTARQLAGRRGRWTPAPRTQPPQR